MVNEELKIARESNNRELILAETKILNLEHENKSFKEEISNLKTDLKKYFSLQIIQVDYFFTTNYQYPQERTIFIKAAII